MTEGCYNLQEEMDNIMISPVGPAYSLSCCSIPPSLSIGVRSGGASRASSKSRLTAADAAEERLSWTSIRTLCVLSVQWEVGRVGYEP